MVPAYDLESSSSWRTLFLMYMYGLHGPSTEVPADTSVGALIWTHKNECALRGAGIYAAIVGTPSGLIRCDGERERE